MKKVLVFAGTTEGRELAELLADSNIKCSVCVATDYALELMNDKRLDVNCGRLTEEEMEEEEELQEEEIEETQEFEELQALDELLNAIEPQEEMEALMEKEEQKEQDE